jgi:hypothetical protein
MYLLKERFWGEGRRQGDGCFKQHESREPPH